MAYSFDQIFAVDEANPSNVAQNASILIYAPGDPAKTPLALTTPDGSPLANPVPVNSAGFGPAFMHATLDRVAWEGGSFKGFFTSYDGMKNEAVAARAAADSAAAAAADAAALVGAPADTAVETLISGTGTATRAALNATYVGPRGKSVTGPAAPAPALNVKDYGAKGDGVADDTAAIRAAGAAGNHLYFPPGNYIASSVADNTALLTFTGQDGVIIDAPEATITNPVEYTADTITPMFKLDACKNVTIRFKKYVGFTLATPATHLGYRGATIVQAINGTNGVKVEGEIINARYGVVSGSYSTPSQGYCKNFDIKLRTSFCGYPVAMYLPEGVRLDIDADDSHRPLYVAGGVDVKGVVRWKNLYIAPVAVLVTDALTGGTDAAAQLDPVGAATTSRGPSDIDILSIDKGSTVFSAETYCIGLSLSRVDPITYRNIRLRFSLAATNTLSTTVHGFLINSAAKSIWNRYPYNWEPHVVLDNVKVSGAVDKSATTISGGAQGPFTIRTYDTDATHAGTVRGLSIEGVVIRPGTAGLAAAQLLARGAVTPIRLRGLNHAGGWLVVDTSATVPTVLDACDLLTVDVSPITGGSRIILANGTKVAAINGTTTRVEMQGGSVRGAGPVIKTKELTATLTGASVTLTGAIPAGCLLLGVQGRITTAITGATGYQVGVTGDLTRWVNRDDTAAGSVFGVNTYAATETAPRYYPSNPDIIITARTANFTAGALRIVLSYVEFPALAS